MLDVLVMLVVCGLAGQQAVEIVRHGSIFEDWMHGRWLDSRLEIWTDPPPDQSERLCFFIKGSLMEIGHQLGFKQTRVFCRRSSCRRGPDCGPNARHLYTLNLHHNN